MTEEQEALKAELLATPSDKYAGPGNNNKLGELVHDLSDYEAEIIMATLRTDPAVDPGVLNAFSVLCERVRESTSTVMAVKGGPHELQCVIKKTFDQKILTVLDNEKWRRQNEERKAKKAASEEAAQKLIDKERATNV